MNFNKLKQRTQQAIEESEKGGNIIMFKKDARTAVRFVPSKEIGEYGWMPVWVHYRSGGVVSKTSVSPKTFGNPDPLEDFVNEELNGKKSTEEFKALMKLKPKLVYITKAVVRGEEEKGVKLFVANAGSRGDVIPWKPSGQWGDIMKTVEDAFIDEPNGVPDISSTKDGYDLYVTNVSKENTDSGYAEYSYVLARRSSPLSEDKALMKELTNEENHPSWKDAYPILTTEQLSNLLEEFINSGGESEEEDFEESDRPAPSKKSASSFDEDEILRKAEEDFKNVMGEEEFDDDVELEEEDEEDPF